MARALRSRRYWSGSGPLAPAIVTSPTTGASSTTHVYGTTTLGRTQPAQLVLSNQIVKGDLLVLEVIALNIMQVPTVGVPAGWSFLNASQVGGSGSDQAFFTKTATAADSGSTVSVPWTLDTVGDYIVTCRVFRGPRTPVVTKWASQGGGPTSFSTPTLTGIAGSGLLLASWMTETHIPVGAGVLTLPGVLADVDTIGGGSPNVLWHGAGALTVVGSSPTLTGTTGSAQDGGEAYALLIQAAS